jgi:hypothetical protein
LASKYALSLASFSLFLNWQTISFSGILSYRHPLQGSSTPDHVRQSNKFIYVYEYIYVYSIASTSLCRTLTHTHCM